ncbi:MAG TPA: enoyl-CoA hydratase [Spirochaetota bacterium]|nr:enoyl-CoA hydratase [Spirochaetota bacterium]
MEKPLLFEVENGIAVITLNRPQRRNCFNRELLAMLYDAIDEVSRNDAITVAIITGNGKSFCTGIDLSVLGKEELFDPRGDGKEYPDIIGACRKPVIGAINGHAITGGFEIALNCDFLIASENAIFGDTHAKVGIHPGWGMTQLLQQAVGQRMAKQMSLTCQYFNAEQALRYGLVNEVVPAERLLPRAMEIASQICAVNREMMMTIKGLIEYRNGATLEEAYANERKEFRKFVEKMADMMKGK